MLPEPPPLSCSDNITNSTWILDSDSSLAEVSKLAAGLVVFLLVLPFVLFEFQFFPIGTTSAVLLGAFLMVLCQVVSQEEVYAVIGHRENMTTIFLLLGMMLLAQYFERERLLDKLLKKFLKKEHHFANYIWRVSLLSFLLSAFFTNDACCAILTPLMLSFWEDQERPQSELETILIAIATSANIGSVTTIFGNPQMALIAARTSSPLYEKSMLDLKTCLMYLGLPAVMGYFINVGFLLLHHKIKTSHFGKRKTGTKMPIGEHSDMIILPAISINIDDSSDTVDVNVPADRKCVIVEGLSREESTNELNTPSTLDTIIEDDSSMDEPSGTSSPPPSPLNTNKHIDSDTNKHGCENNSTKNENFVVIDGALTGESMDGPDILSKPANVNESEELDVEKDHPRRNDDMVASDNNNLCSENDHPQTSQKNGFADGQGVSVKESGANVDNMSQLDTTLKEDTMNSTDILPQQPKSKKVSFDASSKKTNESDLDEDGFPSIHSPIEFDNVNNPSDNSDTRKKRLHFSNGSISDGPHSNSSTFGQRLSVSRRMSHVSGGSGMFRRASGFTAVDFLPADAGLPESPSLQMSGSAGFFSSSYSLYFQVVMCILTVTVVVLFLASTESVPFDMGLVPMAAAILVVTADAIINRQDALVIMKRVDWSILMMFFGIFVWMHGLNKTYLPRYVWSKMGMTGITILSPLKIVILCVFVIVGSNIFSNVPLTIIVLQQLEPCRDQLGLIIYLAWTATIAGNLTLFGSVANLIVAQKGMQTLNYRLTFLNYLKFGAPSTIIIVILGILVIYGLLQI